jgi:hypothetical protein
MMVGFIDEHREVHGVESICGRFGPPPRRARQLSAQSVRQLGMRTLLAMGAIPVIGIVAFYGAVILACESGEVVTLRTGSGSEARSTRLWWLTTAERSGSGRATQSRDGFGSSRRASWSNSSEQAPRAFGLCRYSSPSLRGA